VNNKNNENDDKKKVVHHKDFLAFLTTEDVPMTVRDTDSSVMREWIRYYTIRRKQ